MTISSKCSGIAVFIALLAGSLCQEQLLARQEQAPEHNTRTSQQTGIYPLPILFYTPETGFAGGAAALYLYRDSSSARASSLTADVIYTEKKQFIAELSGDMYFEADRYRLTTDLLFQKYPNKFFGIGNGSPESSEETYTPQTFLFKAVLYRSLMSHVHVGPLIRYEHVTMEERTPGGLLSTGLLPGSTGGTSAGVGIVANWDTRDNTFATLSGSFYQAELTFYRTAFGSDFSYDDLQVDAREFFSPFSDHVVALQGIGEFVNGTVPFQSYAKFGGQNLLRGYFDGRYRDNNMVSLQAEYRMPVWWRFGIVGFVGIAQVADHINTPAVNRFWFAGGMGIRFAWNPDERINIRLDYGAGSNSSGVYFTITEAF